MQAELNHKAFVKIKVAILTGPALDWAVAKAEGGYDLRLVRTYGAKTAWQYTLSDDEDPARKDRVYLGDCSYSTDWSQGGPIIEQEGLHLRKSGCEWQCDRWNKETTNFDKSYGPTPLIAAMRTYVASKLGVTVEIPDNLR